MLSQKYYENFHFETIWSYFKNVTFLRKFDFFVQFFQISPIFCECRWAKTTQTATLVVNNMKPLI